MSNTILVQDDWTSGVAGQAVAGGWISNGGAFVYSAGLGFVETSDTSFSPANTITQDTGELYHSCELTIDTQGTNRVRQGGPVICFVDNQNYITLEIFSATVQFRQITGGGSSSFGNTFVRNHVDGDLYRLERSLNNYVELYVNNVFAMRWPVPGAQSAGTAIGVSGLKDGANANNKFGPLKSKIVIPNLRSLRWRDIQRWSSATEGYAYNNFSASYWVRLNQNISLTGDFELRVQVRQTSAGNPEIVFASSQNTGTQTEIRFQRGFGGFFRVKSEGADYTISDTQAITDALLTGDVMRFRMRRSKGTISIFINEVLYDERKNSEEFLFNAFARGANTTASAGVQYYSWVLQVEDNTVPVALLPAQREFGVGTTITNRGTEGGPNASMVGVPTVETHQWDRYQAGTIGNLDAAERGQVLEAFTAGASGLGLFAFMMWQ